MYNFLANTKRMTISSMVIALYVAVLYVTQGISFGAYQIRIATALYALAFLYPFLVVPLGIANLIANFLFGGLGPLDMAGGCFVGMTAAWAIVQIRTQGWNVWLTALPIWLVPSFFVSMWLICCICHTGHWLPACRLDSCRRQSAACFLFMRWLKHIVIIRRAYESQ